MTNPFAAAVATHVDPQPAAAPAPSLTAAPMFQDPASAPAAAAASAPAAGDTGFGDPFADPTGVAGDGERITDFVDRLLLIRPTEYVAKMGTTKGITDAMRINMAVLDDATEPGKIVNGVLLFQMALKREAKAVMDKGQPYLLGRLHLGETNGGNTLYTFEIATAEEKDLARRWLAGGGTL